jgi:hypothetical protein
MKSAMRDAAGAHLVSGHPPKVPASRTRGMESAMRDAAGAHLVSGHPPKVPASRAPVQ